MRAFILSDRPLFTPYTYLETMPLDELPFVAGIPLPGDFLNAVDDERTDPYDPQWFAGSRELVAEHTTCDRCSTPIATCLDTDDDITWRLVFAADIAHGVIIMCEDCAYLIDPFPS